MTPQEEINLANYWEHFKYQKDLSMIYPATHPLRLKVQRAIIKLQDKLNIK